RPHDNMNRERAVASEQGFCRGQDDVVAVMTARSHKRMTNFRGRTNLTRSKLSQSTAGQEPARSEEVARWAGGVCTILGAAREIQHCGTLIARKRSEIVDEEHRCGVAVDLLDVIRADVVTIDDYAGRAGLIGEMRHRDRVGPGPGVCVQ